MQQKASASFYLSTTRIPRFGGPRVFYLITPCWMVLLLVAVSRSSCPCHFRRRVDSADQGVVHQVRDQICTRVSSLWWLQTSNNLSIPPELERLKSNTRLTATATASGMKLLPGFGVRRMFWGSPVLLLTLSSGRGHG